MALAADADDLDLGAIYVIPHPMHMAFKMRTLFIMKRRAAGDSAYLKCSHDPVESGKCLYTESAKRKRFLHYG